MLLPVRPWGRDVGGVGGAQRSATGVLAAYTVRRDQLLVLTLRFFEHEWSEIQGIISWGQSGESFFWYPDPTISPAVFYTVDLESPRAGEKYSPVRSSDYLRAHEITITLRRTDGQAWDLEYVPGGDQLAWGAE